MFLNDWVGAGEMQPRGSTVGPRLIDPIETEDFSPLSHVHLQREVKSH